MSLDPQAKQMLADMDQNATPPITQLSPDAARQQMIQGSNALGESEPVHSVEDRTVPGSNGGIPIRIYKPAGGLLPIVVYFHGGGWVLGSVETHDGYCRALANAAASIVVSVGYRLAPEHRFPAAADDAYDATCWVSENLKEIGARNGSLGVAGDSAGGNLAAVVALMARDRNGPSIGCQVLIYPITDHDFSTESYQECADGYFLTRESMIWFWEHYCPQTAERNQAYLSPLRADDLRGLPPALVVTAEYDPLRDEGEAFAERLGKAGVDVTLSRYDGMIHGFTRRLNLFDQSRQALHEVANAIKSSIGSPAR